MNGTVDYPIVHSLTASSLSLAKQTQTPDEQYKTLDKDLEGFYEMISYQIDDVHKTFDEILFLRNNGWIVHVSVPD